MKKSITNNPYLNARRAWNVHTAGLMKSLQVWQLVGLGSLLIALAAVGGLIAIGSQSKFIPYIVQVDKLGETLAVSRADQAQVLDERIVHAALASFIQDLRVVTPDVALQRKAIFRTYALLSSGDPATHKANQWYNAVAENNPFKRAETSTVNAEIVSVLPQSSETWQVDWLEKVYDRQGQPVEAPYQMRALIRIYQKPATQTTTEEEIRNNPLGIYVQDFSWSRLM